MGDDLNRPSLGVGITIIEGDRILLTKRRDFPVWCTPGGHLLPGESLIDAAIREAKEETGLDVEILNLVGVYSMPHKWENGSCEVILRASRIGGELLQSTDETIDASFFTLDQLPDDLIGWQYHQVYDALSNKVGIVVILDNRLSLRQFRDATKEFKAGESVTNLHMFHQLCERPNRVDLVNE